MRTRMSRRTRRSGGTGGTYDVYLASRAWRDKRREWYAAWLTTAGAEPACLVCGRPWTLKSGHLHHATYVRVGAEDVRDLLPLCRRHHHLLHSILDADAGWQRYSRPHATAGIIAILRRAQPRRPSTATLPPAQS
ncbi:hypothetical protein FHX52_3236 [Humibacillus xanthopallidus]|uniref:Uncharacterized protein n=1 Tax=Humibacillus xanthopallidus TaxID=412689 RepID=A0A543PR15_9MICO|nr:hypothetical protein FHX52_3236 [Humibacillus xanthopallidus]